MMNLLICYFTNSEKLPRFKKKNHITALSTQQNIFVRFFNVKKSSFKIGYNIMYITRSFSINRLTTQNATSCNIYIIFFSNKVTKFKRKITSRLSTTFQDKEIFPTASDKLIFVLISLEYTWKFLNKFRLKINYFVM